MILIPPGEFLMGSTDEQIAAVLKVAGEARIAQVDMDRIQNAERPQHRVVITEPFYMGATEVTIGQFKQFAADTGYLTHYEKAAAENNDATARTHLRPGYEVTDESPASTLSLFDIAAYCRWLSSREKATYRLPTEAEWEYACRAGTTTQYSFGDDESEFGKFGWYRKNSYSKPNMVGTKLPNAFGLFDMHGNLKEWCEDWYDESWYEKSPLNDPTGSSESSYRNVIRGGSWTHATFCRSAYRSHSTTPGFGYSDLGFRVVRTYRNYTDVDDPAFLQWTHDVAALSADEQINAVAKKLTALNPNFDGVVEGYDRKTVPKIENGVVTEFGFLTNDVADIAPIRALTGLKAAAFVDVSNRKRSLWDLSPLQGMQLNTLTSMVSRSPIYLRCKECH